ncbi:carbon starvation protein A [Salinarchaeum sp. IM2453]|uniref:carbon starvation CstA family protein n=1 Tax=Salinarchaeum sp. IM2453 TaxID=2862870 RepID=UPI001C83A746|nr:carbon starvation CstA family protein [Salinarchaeum sp. IM2453]QZA89675.1 carbon starvation protein A [Salinarchaeum sp. IM2453]
MDHIIWLVLIGVVVFTSAYLVYGRYMGRYLELDDSRETPAHKYQDGQEYVPAKKPVLLGHHFSSIAGGAPIIGPITATLIWGWLPALLWIIIGNPLIGAVHDITSLTSSVRHKGKSIGYVIGEYVGTRGKHMLLWFAFLTLILVVAAFALVTAVVFNAYPETATASILYIGLALVFGVWLYQLNLPFSVGTVIFVGGVFASVWLGIEYPIAMVETEGISNGVYTLFAEAPGFVPELLGDPNIGAWVLVLLVYSAIASVLPVWTLLQPRDYLSSFLLYAGVGGAVLAVIVGTFITGMDTGEGITYSFEADAWYGFFGGDSPYDELPLMPLFPLLFVTISCGAISGFHSLVSSGTTAKQLNKESDARLIGYGTMLLEGMLSIVAISAVVIVAIPADPGGGIANALPNFAEGGGAILTALGIGFTEAQAIMALVLVAFLLTSLDTATRLSRYMVEEIVETPETTVQEYSVNRFINTPIIVVLAFFLLGTGRWEDLWTLFGSANQLLAALAFLAVTVWITNWDKTKQTYSMTIPMVIMLFITIASLIWTAGYTILGGRLLGITADAETEIVEQLAAVVQIGVALTLITLALSLVWIGYNHIKDIRQESGTTVTDGGADDD